jgi:hypothetical protein
LVGGREGRREEEQERRGEGRLCNCKDEVGENSLSLFF